MFYIKAPLIIFPTKAEDSTTRFNAYTDIGNNGTSVIKEFKKNENSILFRYVEGDGFAYPYTGINIAPLDTASFWDLSEYDRINIHLKASKGKIIPITLGLNIENFTQSGRPLSCRSMVTDIDLSKDTCEYTLRLTEFSTPAWWYALHGGINEKKIGAPDFSKCRFIAIQSCNVIKPGIEDQLMIGKIEFYKDSHSLFIIGSVLLLFYYASGFGYLYVIKVKNNEVKPISIQYQSVWTENRFDVETQKIISCITQLYPDQELDLDKVQQETGIPKNRISDLLKESLDLNFRQFLNHLRTNEAKRLLTETDLQVSEIAYHVGYGNISHFNRVFKTLEELSPIDYRKKHLNRKSK